MFRNSLLLLVAVLFSALPLTGYTKDTAGARALTDYGAVHHPVLSKKGMVSAQDRLAAEVGRDILGRGGNAIDAAVATGFALAVTHPQAGNLGGGGFMLVSLADSGEVIAVDFREMAPAGAMRDMYLGPDGKVVIIGARNIPIFQQEFRGLLWECLTRLRHMEQCRAGKLWGQPFA